MGRFQLVPQVGRTYRLRIDSPAGIEGTYDLPKVYSLKAMFPQRYRAEPVRS